jgi:hypothetical protein
VLVAVGPRPSVRLPLGTHEIVLTVDDGRFLSDEDAVTITVAGEPDLVAPAALDFGAPEAGIAVTRTARIANAASAEGPLTIEDLAIAGAGFSLLAPPDLPIELAPGEAIDVAIELISTGVGAAGALTIASNDPDDLEHKVALTAAPARRRGGGSLEGGGGCAAATGGGFGGGAAWALIAAGLLGARLWSGVHRTESNARRPGEGRR